MNFLEAVQAIEAGGFVRREGWHNGRQWVARQEKNGFSEYVMANAHVDEVIVWPLALGRADWCVDDWVIVETPQTPNSLSPARDKT
jgi:hypothetical protein